MNTVVRPGTVLDMRMQRDRLRDALRCILEEDEACRYDVLNPCWNNRPGDAVGRHWGGGAACSICNARGVLVAVSR